MIVQNAECIVQSERASKHVIAEKSFEFAVRIVNLYKFLIREHKEYVMSKQLLRCGTSIGANVAEAQRAQSHADFLSKMSIALKEANEALYWIRLLYRTEYLSRIQYVNIEKDIQEILSLLTAICKTANQNK